MNRKRRLQQTASPFSGRGTLGLRPSTCVSARGSVDVIEATRSMAGVEGEFRLGAQSAHYTQ